MFIAALFTIAKTWAFLLAQLAKSLSVMQETPVQFLGWKDSLELWSSSILGLPQWICSKETACSVGDTGDMIPVSSHVRSLEKERATHSSILA